MTDAAGNYWFSLDGPVGRYIVNAFYAGDIDQHLVVVRTLPGGDLPAAGLSGARLTSWSGRGRNDPQRGGVWR